jgi:hypothetical protein
MWHPSRHATVRASASRSAALATLSAYSGSLGSAMSWPSWLLTDLKKEVGPGDLALPGWRRCRRGKGRAG